MARTATTSRDFNLLEDEYAIAGWWKPYWMMLSGVSAFLLAAVVRVGMWVNFTWFNGDAEAMATAFSWGVVVTGLLATFMIYKLYTRRGEQGGEVLIRFHPVFTALLGIIWLVVAFQENVGTWMFGQVSIFLGIFFAGFAMLTWSARRWAYKPFQKAENTQTNPYGEIGLGDTTVAMGADPIPGDLGKRVRIKPKLGVTLKDFQEKVDKLAQMFGVAVSRIRVWGNSEDPTTVYVDVFDDLPFANAVEWKGPFKPGASIAEPIEFATYDIGSRPQIYLGGKNGGSSQHYLTAGMSGSGKSYGWQSVYGSVLNRKEVSVLYADLAKGTQTVKPLLSGISWFANGPEESMAMFEGVERAIKARSTWLANQDLENWQSGCGLNLLILHIEEAARLMDKDTFSKSDLARVTRIIAESRSAGIVVVYSLQRITHDCIPTSLRYNLGGTLCFGLKTSGDTKIVFGDTPAMPHTLKDNFPGTFYLDVRGLNQDMLGNQLKTDKIDRRLLEQAVIEGAQFRTPMDNTTASALGAEYSNYKNSAIGKLFCDMNSVDGNTENFHGKDSTENVKTEFRTEEPARNRSENFRVDTEAEKAKLWNYIISVKATEEEFSFTEIQKPYTEMYGIPKGTVYKRMQVWVDENKLGMNGKMYFIK